MLRALSAAESAWTCLEHENGNGSRAHKGESLAIKTVRSEKPDALACVDALPITTAHDIHLLEALGAVERFVGSKMVEVRSGMVHQRTAK
jgi:hypothetical protein